MRLLLLKRIKQFLKRRFQIIKFQIQNPSINLSADGWIMSNTIRQDGGDNSILIEAGAYLRNCMININGNSNKLHIHTGTDIHDMVLTFEDDGNIIEIGSGTTVERNVEICACEGKRVSIGEHCMISHDISIRTTDSHSIVNMNGARVNEAKDVIIGNRVWIGCQTLILKGVSVPDGCIIGARSLVTGGLRAQQNTIIAGHPAKVVKTDVSWTRKRQ